MKKSRFTGGQISEALKRVDAGLAVPEIYRVSSWCRADFGGGLRPLVASLRHLLGLTANRN